MLRGTMIRGLKRGQGGDVVKGIQVVVYRSSGITERAQVIVYGNSVMRYFL